MNSWWMRLARYGRPELGRLALLVLLTLSVAAVEALKPWPLKFVVDSVLAGQPFPEGTRWLLSLPGGSSSEILLLWLAAASVLMVALSAACRAAIAYAQAGVATRMVYKLGADLFFHMQKLSLRFHGSQPTGDLVKRITSDSRCVRELTINVFLPLLTSLASLAAMLAFMWKLDRTLCILATLVAPLLLIVIRILNRPMAERSYEHHQALGEITSVAEQTLTALPVVRAFGRESEEDKRFAAAWIRGDQTYLRSILSQMHFRIAAESVAALGLAAVLGIGGFQVLRGEMSLGSLLVFLSYLNALYAPIESLAYVSQGYATASAGARRVYEILDSSPELHDAPDASLLPLRSETSGHIRFEDVTYGYEPGRAVLEKINVEIRPGESVALIGATGAGKSTLVSLIPRFADPWSGRVLLDGIDVRRLRIESLRSQVALVLQEPFLLPLSVAENIAYGRPDATLAEIEAAAASANADQFIRRLPDGYDTVLGERGATLSLGERQRLSIARALLKDAPVLIMDEPTSALDTNTETSILLALERLMERRTTLLIAHRLSTIRKADRILVLAGGTIAEEGTHQELLASGGIYKDYYHQQFAPVPAASGKRSA
jgi:ATP-binding cassette, subfamily B, bacterial